MLLDPIRADAEYETPNTIHAQSLPLHQTNPLRKSIFKKQRQSLATLPPFTPEAPTPETILRAPA